MRFRGVLNDWNGQGSLTAKYPAMNHGKPVLVLGDPGDRHRGPVETGEVANLCIIEATTRERADLKTAGYLIPDE